MSEWRDYTAKIQRRKLNFFAKYVLKITCIYRSLEKEIVFIKKI